jgi:hypothetical protein
MRSNVLPPSVAVGKRGLARPAGVSRHNSRRLSSSMGASTSKVLPSIPRGPGTPGDPLRLAWLGELHRMHRIGEIRGPLPVESPLPPPPRHPPTTAAAPPSCATDLGNVGTCTHPSPFCSKIETFMRMAGLVRTPALGA